MAAVGRVFAARLAGLVVLGPDGESIGRVRDVVITSRSGHSQSRVLGLVVELATRRRIFVPMLRVTSIEPSAITLTTGNVSLRRFAQRSGEVLALAQVIDSRVRTDDPDLPQLADVECVVVDLALERTRTRDWVVSKVALRPNGVRSRLTRRAAVTIVEWQHVQGLAAADPDRRTAAGINVFLEQFEDMRPPDVALALHELPPERRLEIAFALDDQRLADVIQEMHEDDRVDVLMHMDVDRAADILEAMDPDDAADLLGELPDAEAEALLTLMDPVESAPVRRLLEHSPDTAGGLMTPEPVVLTASTTVAEALARARNGDLTPALASMVFVVRPPTATPTGRYIGCVHLQALLREPPANLVGGIVDTTITPLSPDEPLGMVTRYFAMYNLVCGPVVDSQNHLLGAVTVDDVLDHLLPDGWRDRDPEVGYV